MCSEEQTHDRNACCGIGEAEMTPAFAQQLDLDLFSAKVRENPYPFYQRLRTEKSLFWNAPNGAWVITRYHDAVQLLTHPQIHHWAVSASSVETPQHFPRILAKWMTMMDPRTHSCLRRLTAPIFTQKMLDGMSAYLRPLAEQILDDAQHQGMLDVVNDFADPIALAAIVRLFGIADTQANQFRHLARGMIGKLFVAVESTQSPAGSGQAADLIEFLAQLLAEKEDNPPNTLISALQAAQREDTTLTDEELVAFLILFLFAGQENIMNFIGNATYALVTEPEQLSRLREDAALLPNAIDELLRFESPIQFMTVVAMDDISIQGITIPRGDQVLICIGSANRDEARFVHAERLDITRTDKGHLSFGRGPLTCIGSILARLEGGIAIGSLVRRMRHPSLQGPLRLRRDPPVLRGFTSLKLTFDR